MADGAGASQTHIVEKDPSSGKEIWDHYDNPDVDTIPIQCFPLYSVLLAVNRTSVDYFSLDIEGHELKVLKTIPWHKVDIKVIKLHIKYEIYILYFYIKHIQTMTVEWLRIRDGGDLGVGLNHFMEESGYIKTSIIEDKGHTFDSVFIKDFLNDAPRRRSK